MSKTSQYFSYEGAVGASQKTIVIDLKKCQSISITNDGTDRLQIKFNQVETAGTYIRTVNAAETFSIDGDFYSITVISPDTGETNTFRIFALGE